VFKKLAATGILGFAVVGATLASTPAYASVYGGDYGHGHHGHHHHHHGHHGHGSFSHNKTGGNFSVLGGNQVFVPISVPINVCGNAIAVLGFAQASCKGGAYVDN
jgi:ABC-type nickel/cobalt efflux system permease component RcnA